MTAEEKLKELYENPQRENFVRSRLFVDENGVTILSPQDIDLIANLVVERLKDGR